MPKKELSSSVLVSKSAGQNMNEDSDQNQKELWLKNFDFSIRVAPTIFSKNLRKSAPSKSSLGY